MKAKDYARQIEALPILENLNKVIYSLLEEAGRLLISRNCQTQSAFEAVFNQQEDKWIAILRKLNIKHVETENGFLLLDENTAGDLFSESVKRLNPEFYRQWKI